MPKRMAVGMPDPMVLRIPSPEARSVEAALEGLQGGAARRFDVWVMVFARVEDAVALRKRLDEERESRRVALVGLVDGIDHLGGAQAMAIAAEAMAEGIKAVFPAGVPPHLLDRVLGLLLDRQRELAAYATVKRAREEAAVVEAKLRATEQSLARRVYGALTPFTGDVAPVHTLARAMAEFERLYLARVLAEVAGEPGAAVQRLGISRSSLYKYVADHKLSHLVRRHEPKAGEEA